tara:strand:+ start:304 stop:498 length:195 start_codon:yes stop_codon:yes gene_type:complete
VTRKQTLIKSLAWRLLVAIPIGTLVTYLYFGEIRKSIEFMIIMNVLMTFLYYLFDRIWLTRIIK